MAIGTIILFVGLLIASALLKKSPPLENAKRSSLEDFEVPTAQEGRPVPILFGTDKLASPNVVWLGDHNQRALTVTVRQGLFKKKKKITGHEQLIGFQLALCRGLDDIRRIFIEDKVVWTGTQAQGTVTISEPNFFGGNELGTGGIVGDVDVEIGTELQAANAYLAQFIAISGDTPAFRGTAYIVAKRMLVGLRTNLPDISVEARRIPIGLGVTDSVVNSVDANPAHVLYEMWTDDDWGLGLPASDLDLVNFAAVAATLATEGNGFSYTWTQLMELSQIRDIILDQIDATFVLNQSTGLFQINLIRDDLVFGDLPILNEGNTTEISGFETASWDSTSNQIYIDFVDRGLDYFRTSAITQDMANHRIQGANKTVRQVYPGIRDAAIASAISARELRANATPLRTGTVKVNRELWTIQPGQAIRFTNARLGITDLVMRVGICDYGTLHDSKIEIKLIEDVFADTSAIFSPPGGTGFTPPADTMVAIPSGDNVIFEAPKAFIDRDSEVLDTPNRIWVAARNQGDGAVTFDGYSRQGADPYTVAGDSASFIFAGVLASDLSGGTASPATSLILTSTPDIQADILANLISATASDVGANLINLLLVGSEFMACESGEVNAANVQLNNVYRGLLDTAPADHASGARVYVLSGSLLDRSDGPTDTVDVKLVTKSATDELLVSSATNVQIILDNRYKRPYPPVRPLFNGSGAYPATTVDIDQSATGAGDDNIGFVVAFTRRDFRTADEVLAQASEATLPADFPTANTTEYRATVTDDPDGSPTLLFSTAWNSGTGSIPISRTDILANNTNVVPSRLRVEIETRHTVDAVVYSAGQSLLWDVDTASPLLDGDTGLGVLIQNAASSIYTVATASDHTVSIGADVLTGSFVVEYRINAGSWVTIISTGSTSGTILAASLSVSDTLEFRHTQTASGVDTIILVDDTGLGDSVQAFGVLQV